MKKLFRVSVDVTFDMFIAADSEDDARDLSKPCAALELGRAVPTIGPPFGVHTPEMIDASERDQAVLFRPQLMVIDHELKAAAYIAALEAESAPKQPRSEV